MVSGEGLTVKGAAAATSQRIPMRRRTFGCRLWRYTWWQGRSERRCAYDEWKGEWMRKGVHWVAALPKPKGKKEWGFGNGDVMFLKIPKVVGA
jgi:hypothetical protein